MDILWAPWRSKYIQAFKDEEHRDNEKTCFLCEAAKSIGKERELLVVERLKHCFIMMNKFPYNGGHLLIVPYKHVPNLEDLSSEELIEMMDAVKLAIKAINYVSSPHGFNIGINIGRVAGAGVPDHIHIHVVPRWNGDTSFISIISDTKVVSQALDETQQVFSEAFKKIKTDI
ncbi:MAG: HIT domain-containing protein [Candidatus Kapabacteria bacterium]|nr:HIT domain-containing protein [Candidatus Kapabacteria bacterium]